MENKKDNKRRREQTEETPCDRLLRSVDLTFSYSGTSNGKVIWYGMVIVWHYAAYSGRFIAIPAICEASGMESKSTWIASASTSASSGSNR